MSSLLCAQVDTSYGPLAFDYKTGTTVLFGRMTALGPGVDDEWAPPEAEMLMAMQSEESGIVINDDVIRSGAKVCEIS